MAIYIFKNPFVRFASPFFFGRQVTKIRHEKKRCPPPFSSATQKKPSLVRCELQIKVKETRVGNAVTWRRVVQRSRGVSQATHGDYGGYSSTAGTRRLSIWRQGQKVQVRQKYFFFESLKIGISDSPLARVGPKVESASTNHRRRFSPSRKKGYSQ